MMTRPCIAFLALVFLVIPANAKAADCVNYTAAVKDFKLSWTAFKTDRKVGVAGTFSKITTEGKGAGPSIAAVMTGAKVTIMATSVDTGKPKRDQNIAKNFFSLFTGESIEAKVAAVEGNNTDGWVTLLVTMNGVSHKVPMKYFVVGGSLTASGTIDIYDFALTGPFAALKKACKALHKGKTWNDVDLSFSVPVSCK